ncbi:GntR family transcriptional regulator [Streptomyces bohaiensis]|uniref:GntR family transcriptional regulator n=1 Tax=Streptomyces bohaiensis TaxID=1431344 RepID=UPI003B7F0465
MTIDRAAQPYQAIADVLRTDIRTRRLAPHAQLPPARELAATHGVSVGTAQRALSELRREGLIYTHQGRGSYVADAPAAAPTGDLHTEVQRLEATLADVVERLERLEQGGVDPKL